MSAPASRVKAHPEPEEVLHEAGAILEFGGPRFVIHRVNFYLQLALLLRLAFPRNLLLPAVIRKSKWAEHVLHAEVKIRHLNTCNLPHLDLSLRSK